MELTAKNLEATIRQIANERPDFVYATQPGREPHYPCSYLGAVVGAEGGEGCIVGQAFARLGVSVKDLKRIEGSTAVQAYHSLAKKSRYDEASSLAWARAVQFFQDSEYSWGESVNRADILDRENLPYMFD